MNDGIKLLLPSVRVPMGSAYVEQALPTHRIEQIDPFLLLHHWKTSFPGGQKQEDLGVGPHPHRGFSPVTFMFEGAIHHRDSIGNSSVVGAGGSQWINSGSGIIHSERPSKQLAENGGPMELIQLWINTPAEYKMEKAEYIPFFPDQKKDLSVNEVIITNFAGDFEDLTGPMKTKSPLTILRVDFPAGSAKSFSFDKSWNISFYQLDGRLKINASTETSGKQIVWLESSGDQHHIEALEPTRILFMAGKPLEEKVVSYGPFVMNTEEEIHQAYKDYKSGRMGRLNEVFN